METQGEGKSYQGLPSVPPEVATFVTDTLIPQLAGLGTLDDMLTRIDEDINGLEQANPQLAGLVRGTVEGLFGGVGDRLPGERERAYLRVFGFFNAMTLLRALDMAWRRQQPP